MRKHSYRELEKRNTSSWIAFYLEDPEDAKTIFKNKLYWRDKDRLEKAFRRAEALKESFLSGSKYTLSEFAPNKGRIQKALENFKQPQLFAN